MRVSVQTSKGDTALIVAARNGKSDMVQLLIKHGANVDFQVQGLGLCTDPWSDAALESSLSIAALILLV